MATTIYSWIHRASMQVIQNSLLMEYGPMLMASLELSVEVLISAVMKRLNRKTLDDLSV
jgi:hypothetical protein